jgi:hypothetical protein
MTVDISQVFYLMILLGNAIKEGRGERRGVGWCC